MSRSIMSFLLLSSIFLESSDPASSIIPNATASALNTTQITAPRDNATTANSSTRTTTASSQPLEFFRPDPIGNSGNSNDTEMPILRVFAAAAASTTTNGPSSRRNFRSAVLSQLQGYSFDNNNDDNNDETAASSSNRNSQPNTFDQSRRFSAFSDNGNHDEQQAAIDALDQHVRRASTILLAAQRRRSLRPNQQFSSSMSNSQRNDNDPVPAPATNDMDFDSDPDADTTDHHAHTQDSLAEAARQLELSQRNQGAGTQDRFAAKAAQNRSSDTSITHALTLFKRPIAKQ